MKYLTDKMWWHHVGETLKYSLHVIMHPIDGFWDLVHEKRGSIAAANIIVAAAVIVEVLRLSLTNFLFVRINMEFFNSVIVVMRILLPIFLWTVANWSLTTLMDGKGKMCHIYMTVGYALTPYVMMIHDYSLMKTIGSSFLTIIGMGVMVFIFVVFFSLVSDGVAYFVSLYREILFRVV